MATSTRNCELADRRLAAWAGLCAWGALAALAWPLWRGELYLADDLAAFHLPLRQFYRDCLTAGQPFDWLPTLFAGFYVTGEGQLGGYHPLHWLMYRTLPLTTALGLEVWLCYPLLLCGMWRWLRGNGLSRTAAATGGLCWTLGSFPLLHLSHVNAVAILAHIPWLLAAIDDWFEYRRTGAGRSRVALATVALLIGSQTLLGYPQYLWFSLLAVTMYAALRTWLSSPTCVHTTRAAKSLPSLLPLAAVLAALATGLALGAVQLLPTLDSLGDSTRQSADASLAYYGSLHPLNLVQWIGPYLFTTRVVGQNTHELGCYLGAAPLALIVWWTARGAAVSGVSRHLLAFSVGVAVIGLWLATGEHGGLYALQTWLPAIGKFRFPARYLSLVSLAVAALTAAAVEQLLNARAKHPSNPMPCRALATLAAASLLIALTAPRLFPAEFVAAWPGRLAGPLLISAAAGLVWAAQHGVRGALPALLLLMAVDLGAYGLSHSLAGKTAPLATVLASVPGTPGSAVDTVAVALREPGDSIAPTTNHLSLCGRRTLDGYAGLEPARQLDYRHASALRVAGVRFVGRTSRTERIAGLLPFDNAWLEAPDPLPRVRFVTHVCLSDRPAAALAQIDLADCAVVERPLDAASGPAGSAAIEAESPGRLTIRTSCPTRQLLVVADSYHSGWQATVEGARAEVLRVNGDFLGVLVEPGQTRVELRFDPASLRYGTWTSCLALGVVVIAALWPRRQVKLLRAGHR